MGINFESPLIDIILASILCITSFIIYIKYYLYQYWSKNGISQLDPILPFGDVKNVLLRKEHVGETFSNMYKKFKEINAPVGGYYFLIRPELMIMDPGIIKQILVQDFNHFTDRTMFIDEKNQPLTAHLFSLKGQKWKKLRAKITPIFSSGKMRIIFKTMVACSYEFNNILKIASEKREALEIKEILTRFSTDVIGSCIFGIDCNCLKDPNTEFRSYSKQFTDPKGFLDKYRLTISFLFPRITKFLNIQIVNTDIRNFYMKIVNDTLEYRKENNITREDLMQLLLGLKNDVLTEGESSADNKQNCKIQSKVGLTVDQIAAQCLVFFVAGNDTSSTTMAFCLYELVKNPDIQDKVRKEIKTILQKYDGKLTYDAIMEMHYMEKVINETLRKYPVLPHLTRKCTKEYKLPKSNYTIRKGDIIRISLLGLQNDPEYYPEPEKFNPDRFNEDKKGTRHPYTYMPFGEGPRICIGLRFGLMETKIGLSVLLENYRFTLSEKTLDPLIMDSNQAFLAAKGGLWLNVHEIDA